ncbi:zinc ribbon domain-containing protein, partial [Heyndrickxia coagulans]|uniref:zinc ribbon domain-containing protein n=1 Tax=Heyndrickxia coagulans TaxID=1398 RepID=UPI000559A06C
EYKCGNYGVEFVKVDRFFPSSKTCSSCGKMKHDLKLSDRVYRCECGNEIDRDLNAAINLANYDKLTA